MSWPAIGQRAQSVLLVFIDVSQLVKSNAIFLLSQVPERGVPLLEKAFK